jgi:hypothetical protein
MGEFFRPEPEDLKPKKTKRVGKLGAFVAGIGLGFGAKEGMDQHAKNKDRMELSTKDSSNAQIVYKDSKREVRMGPIITDATASQDELKKKADSLFADADIQEDADSQTKRGDNVKDIDSEYNDEIAQNN